MYAERVWKESEGINNKAALESEICWKRGFFSFSCEIH